jgi:hypothetical protein
VRARLVSGAILAAVVAVAAAAAWGQGLGPGHPPSPPPGHPAPAAPRDSAELDCRGCHVGKHRGVAQMYLGTGGRGAPMIPSHMLQVRVECVACHVVPTEDAARAGLVGQTFRPGEQACIACHGQKFRGMLERWSTTLRRMHAIVDAKLQSAHAELAGSGVKGRERARAARLVEDAEFNLRFVALGRGVHNVFYAADLLKVSNGWLDQALAGLGKPPASPGDMLVRGGYCAVLCHEQAGVKLRDTVTLGKQRLPHGRHVTEFGAVCTACHSPEVHRAVTATAATCAACHHGPENDRCEGCHRAQADFYRGRTAARVTVEPNVMAGAVGCTGCHDFTRRHSRQAVREKCQGCHEPPYLALMSEWTTGFDKDAARAAAALKRAETALAAARRAGRAGGDGERLVVEAREALAVVRAARGAHNPAAAEALLDLAREKAAAAAAGAGK